jgi:hypothetical protein
MDRRLGLQIIGVLALVGCDSECSPEDLPAAPASSSVAIGTAVLAPLIGHELLFPAVVVEDRGDGSALVAYADGNSSIQPVAGLRHEGMSVNTGVDAQIRRYGSWWSGEIRQRSHFALFIHFDDGDERWIPTSRVRTRASTALAMGAPRATSDASNPEELALGRRENGDWFYPAVITNDRPGEKHLVYADGSVGWTPEASVARDTIATGTRLEARPRRGLESVFTAATVLQRLGDVLKVRYEDGEESWTSLEQIRIHVTP